MDILDVVSLLGIDSVEVAKGEQLLEQRVDAQQDVPLSVHAHAHEDEDAHEDGYVEAPAQ